MKPQALRDLPFHGVGFELPFDHDGKPELVDVIKDCDLVEIIPEGFFHGKRSRLLKTLADLGTPVVVHSGGLSRGTAARSRQEPSDRPRRILDSVNAIWFSDHVCMTRAGGADIGQLTTL